MSITRNGDLDLADAKFVEVTEYDRLLKGDVLFNNTNSPVLVGKTTYVRQDTIWAYSNHMTKVRLFQDTVHPAWVAYGLHYLFTTGFFKMHCTNHVNQASINSTFLSECVTIPLAPFKEQKRVVAEIEKHFSRLDVGVAALKRLQSNLRRYRASVLKAACQGRLVPQDPNDEPASELLKRILAERRAKWEAEQLARMQPKRDTPRDDRWKRAYQEVQSPPVTNLPFLSSGWAWATFGQLAHKVTKGSSPNWQGFEYQDSGVMFVRSQNVGWGKLILESVAYLPPAFNEKERKSIIQTGDVLLNIVGASIGRATKANELVAGGNVNQAVAVIRPVTPFILPEYLVSFLLSTQGQGRIVEDTVEVARANVSLSRGRMLACPASNECLFPCRLSQSSFVSSPMSTVVCRWWTNWKQWSKPI